MLELMMREILPRFGPFSVSGGIEYSDFEKTFNVAGYDRENLSAELVDNTVRIMSDDKRIQYEVALPKSRYNLEDTDIRVEKGLLTLSIPLRKENPKQLSIK